MASDIWLRTTQVVRKETRCRSICHHYRLTPRVLLYGPSHRQDSTYHGLCYTSRGALMEREIAQWVHHGGSIRRSIAPWANAVTTELRLAPTPLQWTHTAYSETVGDVSVVRSVALERAVRGVELGVLVVGVENCELNPRVVHAGTAVLKIQRREEIMKVSKCFYFMTHSNTFSYGYMASDIR